MVSVLVSCIPALALARRGGALAFRFTLAGTFCFVAMLATTVRGNVPINNRTLALSPEETPPEEWRDLRERWDRLHALRVVLNVTGLGLLLLGTIRVENRR